MECVVSFVIGGLGCWHNMQDRFLVVLVAATGEGVGKSWLFEQVKQAVVDVVAQHLGHEFELGGVKAALLLEPYGNDKNLLHHKYF